MCAIIFLAFFFVWFYNSLMIINQADLQRYHLYRTEIITYTDELRVWMWSGGFRCHRKTPTL